MNLEKRLRLSSVPLIPQGMSASAAVGSVALIAECSRNASGTAALRRQAAVEIEEIALQIRQ